MRKNLGAVVKTPQKPKSTTLDILPAADLLLLLLQYQKCLKMRRRNPLQKTEEDEEMQGETSDTTMTRTETQEALAVKKRLTTKSSTERRTAPCANEPVKGTLTGKTDTKNDDVLMPVEIEGSCLLDTVDTLLSDEIGVDRNPWKHDSVQATISALLDDPREVEMGRLKELNSLTKMGVMTAGVNFAFVCQASCLCELFSFGRHANCRFVCFQRS